MCNSVARMSESKDLYNAPTNMGLWRKKIYKRTTAINYNLKVTCHNWPIRYGYSGKQ